MRYLLICALMFFSGWLKAQTISAAQQKALNASVDYANQSADEVNAVVTSVIDYYPSLHQEKRWGTPRFVCPVQQDEYYWNTAISNLKSAAGLATALRARLTTLKAAADKIDQQCKALDTYHKLEDYKQDNFAKAETLIRELQPLLVEYRMQQNALASWLETTYKKLNQSTNAYAKADALMRQTLATEKEFLDQLAFNVKEDVHTGWAVEKLNQSIAHTDQQAQQLKAVAVTLQYPASSMWTSFQSSLASILEVKRSGLDGYNSEAKKSDAHSNQVYKDLINYYNGALLSDYNTFISFAERDHYLGLKAIKYFTLFEIRDQVKTVSIEAKPFVDIPYTTVAIAGQKDPISKNVFLALTDYVEYINETWRQTRYMQMVLNSFNASASYYKTLDDFSKHGGLHFDFKDYQVPLSSFQKATSEGKILGASLSKPLNDQAEVLLNILKELNDQAASLEVEVNERRYEKDQLGKLYATLERMQQLLTIWDDRKEIFYNDLRRIFDAYPAANPTSSWQVSGNVLRRLATLDHDELFKAKEMYVHHTNVPISTTAIDSAVRDVIAKEYDNMKGIQKIGRNNGLCPYTPYEDLAETSRWFSDALNKRKPVKPGVYEPYHGFLYHYNDIVDDYNKFCELSTTVFQLKTIKQPELYFVKYPEGGKQPTLDQPANNTSQQQQQQPIKTETSQRPKPVIVKQTTVVHDTVYIEKRDTVYMGNEGEPLRSMEGYATNNMILLLDVSGSMNSPDKFPLLKESILSLVSMMRPEDHVSIVTFSSKPKTMLEAASFSDEAKIKKAINNLKSAGKTDGNAGLKLAYKVADENYIRGGNNRIVLATDGEFALNDETLKLIEDFAQQDIFLTIFNFGKGMGSSKSLERLAALGKGNYEAISNDNVELKLIREVKAKRKK